MSPVCEGQTEPKNRDIYIIYIILIGINLPYISAVLEKIVGAIIISSVMNDDHDITI